MLHYASFLLEKHMEKHGSESARFLVWFIPPWGMSRNDKSTMNRWSLIIAQQRVWSPKFTFITTAFFNAEAWSWPISSLHGELTSWCPAPCFDVARLDVTVKVVKDSCGFVEFRMSMVPCWGKGAMLRKSYMAPLGIRSIVNDPMTPSNGLSSIDIINDVYQYIYINHIT